MSNLRGKFRRAELRVKRGEKPRVTLGLILRDQNQELLMGRIYARKTTSDSWDDFTLADLRV